MSQFKLIFRPLGTIPCFVLQRDDGAEFEILNGFGCGLNGWRVPVENQQNSHSSTSLDLLYGYKDEPTLRKISPVIRDIGRLDVGCRQTWHGLSQKIPKPFEPKRHTETARTLNHYWQKAFPKTTDRHLTS